MKLIDTLTSIYELKKHRSTSYLPHELGLCSSDANNWARGLGLFNPFELLWFLDWPLTFKYCVLLAVELSDETIRISTPALAPKSLSKPGPSLPMSYSIDDILANNDHF